MEEGQREWRRDKGTTRCSHRTYLEMGKRICVNEVSVVLARDPCESADERDDDSNETGDYDPSVRLLAPDAVADLLEVIWFAQ